MSAVGLSANSPVVHSLNSSTEMQRGVEVGEDVGTALMSKHRPCRHCRACSLVLLMVMQILHG